MTKIEDLFIPEDKTVLDAMRQLDETGYRILFVAPGGVLRAVITDSDVRRFILRGGALDGPVREMANYSPKSLPVGRRREARDVMMRHSISALPLLGEGGRISDVVFFYDLDIDIRKKAELPVVVMAGGLGSRLYPYTKILPKPLIPVGELPIIEHIIHRFRDYGCHKFHLIVNYKKSMIKSYFSDLEKDYEVCYADEDEPLGTGGGLCLLKGQLKKTFFLSNCDILIDADYGDIYQYHKKSGNVVTMVCAVKHFTVPYGVVELGEHGDITAMQEKPEMNFLTNTGMYVVEPRVVEEMPMGVKMGFTDLIDHYRALGEKVGVYPVSEQSWMDMGQMEELDAMRRRLEKE